MDGGGKRKMKKEEEDEEEMKEGQWVCLAMYYVYN